MTYQTINLDTRGEIARLFFNRPEIHNAFNSTVIYEMLNAFQLIQDDRSIRLVVLSGTGKSFCAGADLNWMRSVISQSFDENLAEATALAELFYTIYTLPQPVIARVNGAAIGGGTGFVAVCDFAVAARSAKFSFSEVKIGVVPACIGPYVVKKIGEGRARELFITGERMGAERAHEVGLVNRVVDDDQLDAAVDEYVNAILTSGPEAVAMAKKLVSSVPLMTPDEFKPFTADMIARLRASDEGQEGMDAFLNKRPPAWAVKKEA